MISINAKKRITKLSHSLKQLNALKSQIKVIIIDDNLHSFKAENTLKDFFNFKAYKN